MENLGAESEASASSSHHHEGVLPNTQEARERAENNSKVPVKRSPWFFVKQYLSCLLHTEQERARVKAGNHNWFMSLLLLECWTDGSLIALKTDIFAGVTLAVAQIAPSVAFALMAKAEPLVGLFSSFWLGIICCIFGGRPGQITAIAGAVVVLYPDLVMTHGYGAACAVSLIAGCFILLPGIFRVARLVRLLPSSLMVGFCNGLGLSMVIHQIPAFKDPKGNYVTGLEALYTAIICVISYCIMMLLPYFTTVVPSAFVAVVIGTAIQYIFQLKTVTIGDLYQLHGDFPKPMVPNVDWSDSSAVKDVMVASVLTAIISCVESFMSDYKMQQLTETPTNFEREALALGVAHIVNGFFQGTAGCVVYGPCILNIECGAGTRRLSGFICAVLMVIIPVALYMVIGIVPMAALSAVLFGVSSKTADWRMLAMIFLQRISFQESVVAILVTVVTVVSDLAIGAAAGLAAALVFFMWNMSHGRVNMAPVHHIVHPHVHTPALTAPLPRSTDMAAEFGVSEQASQRDADDDEPFADSCVANEDSIVLEGVSKPNVTHVPPSDAVFVTHREEQNTDGAVEDPNGRDGDHDEDEFSDPEGSERRPRVAFNDCGSESGNQEDSGRARQGDRAGSVGEGNIITPESANPNPAPLRNTSLLGNPYAMVVDFLAVRSDHEFPEIKKLTVKMSGILFFGSCMEFVDGFTQMLHEHHQEIFLKVTDMILDFQNGMMTVMDFSAAEALQDAARILAKRGIRTHLVHMDPMSSVCFDRCRRYFPDVSDNNIDNQKHKCYVRRLFKAGGETTLRMVDTASPTLNDDVFLRANRSFTTTLTQNNSIFAALERGVSTECATEQFPPLSSCETQLPLEETLEVGFPIYRPDEGITVTVFATVPVWRERMRAQLQTESVCSFDVGLTLRKPFNRQFGDFFTLVWLRRIWKHDLRVTALKAQEPPTTAVPHCYRPAPTDFEQVPRFRGQGYSKGERLSRREWVLIKRSVHRTLFNTDPPKEPNVVKARAIKFEKDLLDGFI